ncbi:MAG: uracil-DNA glycosylase family protein [Gemmatimonadaceae bacterium]
MVSTSGSSGTLDYSKRPNTRGLALEFRAFKVRLMARSGDTFAARAFRFYKGLTSPRTPRGVIVMNPYMDARVRSYVRLFLEKYFDDNRPRTLVLGINPGRFGAGITGVTFTDPKALADPCGVRNSLPRKHELSSVFIYKVIDRFGGPRKFYRNFFLTAVSPLGFIRKGINLNYYDDRLLARSLKPFIVETIERQIAMGGKTDRVFVLGISENFRFLRELNAEHGFFRELVALEHPRWIMQYQQPRIDEYVEKYYEVLSSDRTPPDVPTQLLPHETDLLSDRPAE